MQFKFTHNNINVADLERSLAFYKEALGFEKVKEKAAEDGSFKIVWIGDGVTDYLLELTWLKDHPQPYDLGENEIHQCIVVDDYEAAHALHQKMGCICFENTSMGLYFIEDPDGYWVEIVPTR